jgi:uncharacterized protein (DUF433 family)
VTSPAVDIYGGRDPRDIPAYSITSAASLVGIPETTLRSWVFGRTYATKTGPRRAAGLIKLPPSGQQCLSFTNLVEAHVLAAMRRKHELKLETVRRAVSYLKRESGQPHPLASETFRTNGVDLFVERYGHLVNASQDGQIAIREAIEASLDRVEYDKGRAVRLFPVGPTARKSIEVDPRRAFGRPVIAGTGIPIAAVADRFRGGDSIEHLARDFGVDVVLIEDAVRAAA